MIVTPATAAAIFVGADSRAIMKAPDGLLHRAAGVFQEVDLVGSNSKKLRPAAFGRNCSVNLGFPRLFDRFPPLDYPVLAARPIMLPQRSGATKARRTRRRRNRARRGRPLSNDRWEALIGLKPVAFSGPPEVERDAPSGSRKIPLGHRAKKTLQPCLTDCRRRAFASRTRCVASGRQQFDAPAPGERLQEGPDGISSQRCDIWSRLNAALARFRAVNVDANQEPNSSIKVRATLRQQHRQNL